jgi:hypothetical protein
MRACCAARASRTRERAHRGAWKRIAPRDAHRAVAEHGVGR